MSDVKWASVDGEDGVDEEDGAVLVDDGAVLVEEEK